MKGDTELKDTSKEELIRSERLAFTGRIAANIAHEIRNPLTNVTMAVQQLKKVVKMGSASKHIEIITRNVERINYLITELLNCARPPKLDMRVCDMHQMLENVLESGRAKIESQVIKVVKRFTAEPSTIHLDKEHMERALLNLVTNAVEAMPKGGILTIETERDEHLFMLSIRDTGAGIREEDIIRVFDPFFSTKSEGVGLGLTICYGIIVSHGGIIEVESKPKEGSVFTVSLPI